MVDDSEWLSGGREALNLLFEKAGISATRGAMRQRVLQHLQKSESHTQQLGRLRGTWFLLFT